MPSSRSRAPEPTPTGRSPVRLAVVCVLATAMLAAVPAAGQTCPPGPLGTAKSSALYLYFPTSEDATFPDFSNFGADTTPVGAFDMAEHDGSLSTSQVRQRVLELMQAGYCEFDLEVKLATSTPSPTETRWQVLGIGSDESNAGGLVGEAESVDTGDTTAQDYSRLWVESLETYAGGELTGGNSTLERWAVAIANLSAHESAHNYGAAHSESAPQTGEDSSANHFIADPGTGASPGSVTDTFNHFSDTVYERFGHDIGLNIKTLHNWDFVNPNGSNADSLVVTLLSSASSLTIGWSYAGPLSPWTSPTITQRPGTISFRGTSYNAFDLLFSTPKSWSGGADGVAPPGEKFHVGASFSEADPVIVYETTLRSGGSDLPLQPRMFGYDAGTASPEFALKFYNPQSEEEGPLLLSDVQVFFLPRMVDLDEMVEGGDLVSPMGVPVRPFERRPGERGDEGPPIRSGLDEPVEIGDEPFLLPIAHLTDRRHLERFIDTPRDCEPGREPLPGPGFGLPGVRYCPERGYALSLFPATYTFVVATVTDPDARFWDPSEGRMVEGPLESRLFFQVAGIIPDFNDNGVDDLIDIRTGDSSDENRNGIPDEAERRSPWAVSVHGGFAIPEGSTANRLDDGFSVDVGLEYALSPHLSVLGVLGYADLSDDGFGSNLELIHATVGARYYPWVATPWRPFAEAGVGLYDASPGDRETGVNAGIGLRYDLGGRLSLEAIYRRHEVDADPGADLEFAAAQLGLRWTL